MKSQTINLQRAMIEFVVILSGVFAALIADSAMDNYRDRQSTREVLEALREDITADYEELESYWAPQLLQQEESRHRLEVFLKGSDPVEDALEFVNDVRWISSYYTFNPNTVGIEDLINSGSLSLLKNIELRRAILNYRQAHTGIAESDVLHRAYFLDLYGELSSNIIGGLALPYSVEAELGKISNEKALAEAVDSIDEEFIRSSDMLRRLLVNTSQAQLIKQRGYLRTRDDARALIAMLNDVLVES